MYSRSNLGKLLALVLLALVVQGSVVQAAPPSPDFPQADGPIVADHTTTDLSQVPAYWIEKVKDDFLLSYGHTSHGSQIVSGMGVLMADPVSGDLYAFNTNGAVEADILSLADRVPSGDLGNPDRVTWAARTREYLDGSGSDRNVVMWSWCGQVSSATEEDINTYLDLMNELEQDYPGVTFIYMTGHLDGTGVDGNLHQRNEQIRAYVRANDKILFDFADIESYDPDGNYYLDRGASDTCDYDGGNWATEWCAANPDSPLCETCSCAHSEALNCNLKARAFWWMMVRLAGWSGAVDVPVDLSPSTKSVAAPMVSGGETITYTVVVRSATGPITATVSLTDTLPAPLSYVTGSLTATGGLVDDSAAPTLRWSGSLSPTGAVTVTYATTFESTLLMAVTNTVTIGVPGQTPITRTATFKANYRMIYLPLVLKSS